jgi:hypothetical protein
LFVCMFFPSVLLFQINTNVDTTVWPKLGTKPSHDPTRIGFLHPTPATALRVNNIKSLK